MINLHQVRERLINLNEFDEVAAESFTMLRCDIDDRSVWLDADGEIDGIELLPKALRKAITLVLESSDELTT